MSGFIFLIPISVVLGITGWVAFFWPLNNRQYDDMDGASHRILLDEDDKPID